MIPDLNRLKVFYFIYESSSVVGAAEKLYLTQSAISQHLHKLEDELKTKLFTRSHRKMTPTSAGHKLFGVIKPFLEELESEVQYLDQSGETPMGILKMGTPVEFGQMYFPEIFASFRSLYPKVGFSLEYGDSSVLTPKVLNGELDFAFTDMFLSDYGVTGKELSPFDLEIVFEEELVLACSKKYYEEHVKGDHSYNHLSRLDYINYHAYDLVLVSWYKHHFGKTHMNLNVVFVADSAPTVKSAIKHHMGLGFTSPHLIWDDLETGEIRIIKTEKNEVKNRIALVQLKDKIHSLTERTFQGFFKKQIKRMAKSVKVLQH